MNDLTLLVIGKDYEAVKGFKAPGANVLIRVANVKSEPLSVIANRHLNVCTTPVFGLCHADVAFGPGALEAFTTEALLGRVCGIAGALSSGAYCCCYALTPLLRAAEVSTLDGMAVFLRPDMGLRFDEQTFDGFHCHVEDLCLQAHERGYRVTVPAADAHHVNHEQTKAWQDDYRKYRAKLAEKWKGTEFRTT